MAKKILIIEDDSILRDAVVDFLIEVGYEVVVAVNGYEGVNFAMNELPDLILCDINLPGIKGTQIFSMLQQTDLTAIIPFIFITSMTENEDIRAGMQLGVDDYITKPFDLDHLNATINTRIVKKEKFVQSIERNYKIFFDNPLNAVYIFNESRFEFMNSKMMNLIGITDTMIEDISFINLFDSKDHLFIDNKIRLCYKGINEFSRFEAYLLNKNNERIKVKVCLGLTNYRGKKSIIGLFVESDSKSSKDSKSNEEISRSEIEDIIETLESHHQQISKDDFNRITKMLYKKIESRAESIQSEFTERELEVLQLLYDGKSSKEISVILQISERTVDRHKANLFEKTNAKSSVDLIVFAIKHLLVNM